MIAQFQIINKVLQNKDYSFITLNNLTAEHFYGYKAEYEFIKAHYNTYHTVPDRLTFLQHFPEFVVQDVNEPDNYLIGPTRSSSRSISAAISGASGLIPRSFSG